MAAEKRNLFAPVEAALTRKVGASSDFDLNPGFKLPENRKLRPAAVLVPLIARKDGLHVYLTKRASTLQHHPGQVAFPGGKVDDTDADVAAAALREAEEEIGLRTGNVRVFGELATHETVTSFLITPIVAQVMEEFQPSPEPGEVDEVFTVPFSYLMQPEHFRVESRLWRGLPRRYYTIPHGPYYIWGATARILRGLAERMKE
ncbi:MAG: CoA pyrophosphatase [Paracoccaceae bacterium]|nr:CoA pyrophosphatase [Paracoccaceae bacterium]